VVAPVGRAVGLWQNRGMLDTVRAMPNGVRLFLAYGLGLLALIGLVLPGVVAMAAEVPITGPGVVLMLLLAYTIFTLTLVLQRKRAAWWLAVGLSSLTVPLVLFLVLAEAPLAALVVGALTAGLFLGLRTAAARRWFDQE
jgi:succinate-acetate transporter protein